MTKLTLEKEAPAVEVVADPNRMVRFSDADGRLIGIRRVVLSKRMRVVSMLGKDSQNETILNYALGAAAVCELHGDPVATPRTLFEMEALWDRLDDVGMQAISEHYGKEFAPEQVDPDALKNS